jgi:hypothetical protein
MPSILDVYLLVLEELELKMLMCKVCHQHKRRAVGAIDRQSTVVELLYPTIEQAYLAF